MYPATLSDRFDVILKPADYIGLYIIVIAASGVTVNGLFRIHFRQGHHLIVLQITMLSERSPPWSYDGVDPISVCEAPVW